MFELDDKALEIVEMCLKCCQEEIGRRKRPVGIVGAATLKAKNEITVLLMRIANHHGYVAKKEK